jgi:hypothetical protein
MERGDAIGVLRLMGYDVRPLTKLFRGYEIITPNSDSHGVNVMGIVDSADEGWDWLIKEVLNES